MTGQTKHIHPPNMFYFLIHWQMEYETVLFTPQHLPQYVTKQMQTLWFIVIFSATLKESTHIFYQCKEGTG